MMKTKQPSLISQTVCLSFGGGMKFRMPGLLALVTSLLLSATVYAQSKPRSAQRSSKRVTYETATTKSGRTVILKSDGTWVYADEQTQERSSTTEPVETDAKATDPPIRSTLMEVMSDEVGFIGKKVLIADVDIKINSNYFCKYIGSEATYYAFTIQDTSPPYKVGFVYMKRSAPAARELRRKLLTMPQGYTSWRGSFVITFRKNMTGCGTAELLDYKLR